MPCYVDVKTIYESSQAQAINQPYLEEFFDEEKLNKYLISRNFIRSTLKGIYEEIDKLEKTKLNVKEYSKRDEEYHWFALAAFLCVLLEVLLRNSVLKKIP